MRINVLWRFLCVAVLGLSTHVYASEVVFGHISSLANPASTASAKELQAGIRLAFEEVNATGGVAGSQLKLETRDDNLDPAKMVALTDDLAADPKILGLIGYLNTGGLTELAKADALKKLGLPLISPFQGNAAIVQAANIFPFRAGYPDEITAILKNAKDTFKSKVAIVHFNIVFGPPMAKFAVEQAAKMQVQVTDVLELDGKPNGDLKGSISKSLEALKKSKPNAVILVAAGKPAMDFVSAFHSSGNDNLAGTGIYAMSPIVPEALISSVGPAAALGVVLAQATPFPYSATSPIVGEYQKALKKFDPQKKPSFAHLEGYIGGRITALALAKAGSKPTRQSLLRALYTMGTVDLGGPIVSYTEKQRRGWGNVELVMIAKDGRVTR